MVKPYPISTCTLYENAENAIWGLPTHDQFYSEVDSCGKAGDMLVFRRNHERLPLVKSMKNADVTIVFRALNEEKYFEEALKACRSQVLDGLTFDIVLVDSGSTDRTLEIAKKYECQIVHIPKHQFSFGRSLNWGCEAASGDYLIFISAHCIPTHDRWLQNLIQPLIDDVATYSYGRQIGNEVSKFSEKQLFAKYFPDFDKAPQDGFFINNANSAIKKSSWTTFKFDEDVTGLEDMVLGKQLVAAGEKIAYIADAPVIHIHEETYRQVKRRYYREALTLRAVLPEVHMSFFDFIHYTFAGISNDFGVARRQKSLLKNMGGITLFRIMQFWGSYKGQNENRKLSRAQKEEYYYPRVKGQNVISHAPDQKSLTEA
jgi:glycosyltransferase involved in cell wall biosynthesis